MEAIRGTLYLRKITLPIPKKTEKIKINKGISAFRVLSKLHNVTENFSQDFLSNAILTSAVALRKSKSYKPEY